ncbi:unnamed protein product, partial [Closterium sp. NIES-65]
MAYFVNWAGMDPSVIPAASLTHVFYAFALIDSSTYQVQYLIILYLISRGIDERKGVEDMREAGSGNDGWSMPAQLTKYAIRFSPDEEGGERTWKEEVGRETWTGRREGDVEGEGGGGRGGGGKRALGLAARAAVVEGGATPAVDAAAETVRADAIAVLSAALWSGRHSGRGEGWRVMEG